MEYSDDVFILLKRRRQVSYLPAGRNLQGNVIDFLKGKLDVNGVDTAGVLKHVLLRSAEESYRNAEPGVQPPMPNPEPSNRIPQLVALQDCSNRDDS